MQSKKRLTLQQLWRVRGQELVRREKKGIHTSCALLQYLLARLAAITPSSVLKNVLKRTEFIDNDRVQMCISLHG